MTNSTIITFYLPTAVPLKYQWLSDFYILSFGRLLLAFLIFGLPFALSYVYKFFAIPKAYEGISNEELENYNRRRITTCSTESPSFDYEGRTLYRVSVISHVLHEHTLHQETWTAEIVSGGILQNT